MSEILDLLNSAIEIARLGGDHTLEYFKKEIEVISKEDDSPVTVADREAEQLMRKEISNRFPTHGIIGEEFGKTNEGSNVQWVLDPIDGTKSFIHGIPFYTTLVGVLLDNEPLVGVIYCPALDEICAAVGYGVTHNGKSCQMKKTESLEECTVLVTEINRFNRMGMQTEFQELLNKTKIHRTWGDAYGHMMVATGRAEIMIDPILSIWDATALLPIMKEAGGIFSDFDGNETIHTGNGFSTNKHLYPLVTKIFEGHNSQND